MTSVTGNELSRARSDDRFRAYSHFAFARPLGSARAATKGLLAFVGVIRDALGHEDELFLVPVVVVNVGAIEAVDHRGGTIKPLYGLEDFEGDAGAVVRVGVAPRIDGEDDVRERRGERRRGCPDFPVVVPGADVEDRGDGLPCGTAVCGSEFEVMSRMRAVHSAMHSSQVPEVTSRRYSLPTCAMRARNRVFAVSPTPCFVACTVSASPCITVGSPEPNCATVAASIISFSPLSDCG